MNIKSENFFPEREETVVRLSLKNYVKQANDMTQAFFTSTSLNAKKILAYLIASIPENLPEGGFLRSFKTSAQGLIELLEESKRADYGSNKSSYYQRLLYRAKDIVSQLRGVAVITKDIHKKNKSGKRIKGVISYSNIFRNFAFTYDFDFENQKKELVFLYDFNHSLEKYFLNLKKNYTTYNLSEYISLPSLHSMRLYELLAQFKTTGIRQDNLTDLKELMGVEKKFENFNDFLRKVLLPAQKTLQKTSMAFDFRLEICPVENSNSVEQLAEGERAKVTKLVSYTPKRLLGHKVLAISFYLQKTSKIEELHDLESQTWWSETKERRKKALKALANFGVQAKMLVSYAAYFSDKELEEMQELFYGLQYSEKGKAVKDKVAYINGIFQTKIKKREAEMEEANLMSLFDS